MRLHAIQEHPRYPASFPVEIAAPDGAVARSRLADLSLGGVFVRTQAPPAPGTRVDLRIVVDEGAPPVAVSGRVVHVLDAQTARAKGREPGMGVAFDAPPPEVAAAIARATAALAQKAVPAPSVVDVLAAARAIQASIRQRDLWGALRLPPLAPARDVTSRATQIAKLFTSAIADAAGEQREELARAAEAVRDVERTLLARIAAIG